jgi:hypothetical protein
VGPLGAAPAQAADKVLTGTLLGADGRAVGALLGFDLRDGQGRALGASGCVRSASCPVEGYAVTRRVNFGLGPDGAQDAARWVTTWSVALPAEAARVYVEVFPQGRGYAGTDQRRYAPSFRRNLPVPYGSRVNLRLPLVSCAGTPDGPRVGWVNGYATEADGDRVRLRRITAYSMEPDDDGPTPVLGLGEGTVEPNGYYRVAHLASGQAPGQRDGQRYQLIATAVDGRVSRVFGVRVRDCRGVAADVRF